VPLAGRHVLGGKDKAMSTHFGMSKIFRATSAMIGSFEAARRQRRTERALGALPDYMLKDIGYGRDLSGQAFRVRSEL
jgi:uncharacterized protein YjiS (DUF1127 family)